MLHVLLWFDTEDYITPESDEALLRLLQVLRARNVHAAFKIVGEKARVLRSRNRVEILSLLRDQDIGYHTDFHSVHPTPSEYLEAYSFREGVQAFESRERGGLLDVSSITGKLCSSYGQPGYAWAPQVFPSLKHWGIDVYLDSHDAVTMEGNPFWYGGLLNFTDLTGTMRMELRDNGLEKAKIEFDTLYDTLPSNNRFVSIYYHPCEFATTEFWDGVNFAQGRNPGRELWCPAQRRTPAEMEHHLNQFGEFLSYTLSKDDVRYTVPSELLAMEKSGGGPLPHEVVKALAQDMNDSVSFRVIGDHSLSASDIFKCFYSTITGNEFPSEILYGPEGYEESEIESFTVSDMENALQVEYPQIHSYRQLPNAFLVNGRRVHPVDMTCAMARAVARDLRGEDRVTVVKGGLMSENCITQNDWWGPRWPIFEPDMHVPNIIRQARLQAWTLKPALFWE